MKYYFLILSLISLNFIASPARADVQKNDQLPAWAYAQNPPNMLAAPDDNSKQHVPHSKATYLYSQVKDLFFAPDWHPDEHPSMPDIVAYGRKPDVFACGVCHRADGSGGPENASLSGLPKAYILQQIKDFKDGTRNTSAPDRPPVKSMISLSKVATDDEIEIAADYFANLKPRKNITVIETDTAPKTFARGWHLAKINSYQTEPLGERIIEVPVTLSDFINRDSHAQFAAYAPKGSVKQGRILAARDSQTTGCENCHGQQLRGSDIAPHLAGRSPTYIVRQLYDFKYGSRHGANSHAMQAITKNMSVEDMIALAAYSASLTP